MILHRTYIDTMDASRHVTPVKEDGTCRISFDGVHVGKARIPPSLFKDEPSDRNTGYDGRDFWGFTPFIAVKEETLDHVDED